MKIRIAKKVIDRCTDRTTRDSTLDNALRRVRKTESDKEMERWWKELMAMVRRQRDQEIVRRAIENQIIQKS